MYRPLLFLLCTMLLTGCAANHAGAPANAPSAVSSGQPASPTASFTPVASSAAPPSASSRPASAASPQIPADDVASVQVVTFPLDDDSREALQSDNASDRTAIARIVQWLGEAQPAPPIAVISEDDPGMNLRSPVQAVIRLKSGAKYTLELVCEPPPNGKADTGGCSNPAGKVNVYEGENAPVQLISEDLAYWLDTGFRAETTVVVNQIAPRAVGDNGDGGRLELMPESKERYRQLDASSCVNGEGDYRFTGDYDVVYRGANGVAQQVAALPAFSMIRPDKQTIRMDRLDFGTFAAFALYPGYMDCHGLEFYLYGVADGKAFPLTFDWEGEHSATFSTDPVKDSPKPRVVNGKLVVDGGYAAGMDNRTRFTFEPDVQNHTMKLAKEEPLPIEEPKS